MKGLVCKVCGHIALTGEAPEECPFCQSPQTAFEENDTAIKDPDDPANLADPEKKHTPDITVVKDCGLIPGECTDVHVRVGIDILHPMTPEHYIGWLDFYVDKVWQARVKLSSKVNPGGGVHLKKDAGSKVTVVSWCNQHGSWLNEADL